MTSNSPADNRQVGRLKGLRGARRVWSSDEEEETKKPLGSSSLRRPPARQTSSPPAGSKAAEQVSASVIVGGPESIGPGWTRGEMEGPAGVRDMGSWTKAVYTEEQQRRINVDEIGNPLQGAYGRTSPGSSGAPAKVSRQTSPAGLNAAQPLPRPTTPSRTRPESEQAGMESFQIAQLRAELANATAAVQAQSQEMAQLISTAKGEVAGLCRSVKSERDMVSRKANEHQVELERVLNSSRRIHQDAFQSSGPSTRPRHLGEDLAYLSGGLSVAKVQDIIERVLFKFEDSLVSKAGFIGGLFHSWRCEVALNRLNLNFNNRLSQHEELLKDRRHKQLNLILAQWQYGSTKGLLKTAMHCWLKLKQDGAVRARIQLALLKFFEGSQKGLMDATFTQWFSLAREMMTARLSAQESAEKDSLIQTWFDKFQQKHKKGKEDMYIAFGRWMKGGQKGLLLAVLKAWYQRHLHIKDHKKNKAAMSNVLLQLCEGKDLGLKRSCWHDWWWHTFHTKKVNQERLQLENWLNSERMRHEEEERERLSAEEMRRQQAKNASMLLVEKWILGNRKGLLQEVVNLWHKYARSAMSRARQREAVQAVLLQSLEGQRRGIMTEVFRAWKARMRLQAAKNSIHLGLLQAFEGEQRATLQACVQSWSSYTREANVTSKFEEELERHKQEMEGYLNDMGDKHADEMQQLMSEADLRKAKAHEATLLMMKEWMRGETVGLLSTVISDWSGWVQKVKAVEQRHEKVKLAVMRFVEGDARASVHICMVHWKKYYHDALLHSHKDEISSLEQRLEGMIAHNKTHLTKYAAMLGGADDPMFISMVFSQWKSHSYDMRSAAAARRHEIQLEEMQRLHDIAVTVNKEKKVAALEMLGFKNNKEMMLKHFLAWSTLWQRARQEHIHKLTHNVVLDQYSLYVLRQQVKQTDGQLLGTCFHELNKEAHHCKNMRMHQDYQHCVEELRYTVMQLTQERQVLSEQLQTVYQQLDSVTDTLQKELKTKEELAAELREANDQMRKVSLRSACMDGSTLTLSVPATPLGVTNFVPSVHDFSHDGSPDSQSGSGAMFRVPSAGTLHSSGSQQTLHTSQGPHKRGYDPTPPLPMEGFSDGMVSKPWRGSITPRRRQHQQDTDLEPPLNNNGRQSDSPNCNWESAVTRMRDEGLFRTGEAPRL